MTWTNALRMQAAVDYVAAHPGALLREVTCHILAAMGPAPEDESMAMRAHRQAAGVVERVVRRRLLRLDGATKRLYPWDERWRSYAEALERVVFAAPTTETFQTSLALAVAAWNGAQDPERARTFERLVTDSRASRTKGANASTRLDR